MYCRPPCAGCVAAGSCPKGQLPAASRVRLSRSKPRRAVAATYPRDVRTVYVHLACGHTTTKEAQVFFSVWKPKDDEKLPQLYCETCHGWTVAQVTLASEPPTLNF